jgi:hypothetical protein
MHSTIPLSIIEDTPLTSNLFYSFFNFTLFSTMVDLSTSLLPPNKRFEVDILPNKSVKDKEKSKKEIKKSKKKQTRKSLQSTKADSRDDTDPPGAKSPSNEDTKVNSRNIFEILEAKAKLKKAEKKVSKKKDKTPKKFTSKRHRPTTPTEKEGNSASKEERNEPSSPTEKEGNSINRGTDDGENSLCGKEYDLHFSDWRTQLLDQKNVTSNKKSTVEFHYIETKDSVLSYDSFMTNGTNHPYSCLDMSCL